MGTFEAAVAGINQALGPDGLPHLDAATFAPGNSLVEAVAQNATQDRPEAVEWVSTLPGGIQEAIRALVHHNLSSPEPRMMTFAWAPGYDYELTVWEGPDTDRRRGITVLVKTRYPDDAHPAVPNGPTGS